ncbi:hypothetical protein [Gilliamella sp. App2-1]|nr:hypothetical protein [Gilliamella apicola]
MTIFLLELCDTKLSDGKVTGDMIFNAVKKLAHETDVFGRDFRTHC